MKIIEKVYYMIKFTLSSPLALSSGENNYADKDIIRDPNGKPYIPASSIAGVCKNALKDQYKDSYLGYVKKADKSNLESSAEESMLMLYDATIDMGSKYTISVRDGIGLDEYKTTINGAKYDMEVLEPGVVFVTFIEQNITESKPVNVANILADLFMSNKLCFGGKTSRGYGDISDCQISQKKFNLQDRKEAINWISFDMYSYDGWDKYEESREKQDVFETIITLHIKQKSGISIRKYSTRPGETVEYAQGKKKKKIPEPDYEQLTLSSNGSIPSIPGTSWAGAFGHQMKRIGLSDADYENLFGYVKGNKTKKSLIRFSETQLLGAVDITMSRNAIDRFSGGTTDGALFTERTYYNGCTDLKISVRGELNSNQAGALAASISDLGYGFLAVGGLTAIGRGLFTIEKINGEDVKADEIFKKVKELLTVSGGENK